MNRSWPAGVFFNKSAGITSVHVPSDAITPSVGNLIPRFLLKTAPSGLLLSRPSILNSTPTTSESSSFAVNWIVSDLSL